MVKPAELRDGFAEDPCSIPGQQWPELFTLLPEERNGIGGRSLHTEYGLMLNNLRRFNAFQISLVEIMIKTDKYCI